MKRENAKHSAIMTEALKAIKLEQNKEIGEVNALYGRILIDHIQAEAEIDRIKKSFKAKWGNGLEEYNNQIDKINKKYVRILRKAMKDAGIPLDAVND